MSAEVPIYIRPHARPESLTYYWDMPSSLIVSSFNLTVTDISNATIASNVSLGANRRWYTVSNLNNGQKYAGGIYQIGTDEVSSIVSEYRSVIPGYKPGAPQNAYLERYTEDQVVVYWETANSNGNAEIFWHMVRDEDNSNMRLPARAYQRGMLTPQLSTGTHRLYVQAINDPGYGVKAILPTITIPFTGSLYNYIHWETFSGNTNFYYRTFNTGLGRWSSLRSFGYDTTYSLVLTPVKDSEVYTFGFLQSNNISIVFVGSTGSIRRTITIPYSGYRIARTRKSTVLVFLDAGIWKFANYDYDNDTLNTYTSSYTNASSIVRLESYRDFAYCVIRNGSTGQDDHYVVYPTNAQPTYLFTTGTFYSYKVAQSGCISVITLTNAYFARPNQTIRTYTFSDTGYTSIIELNQFGINKVMTEVIMDKNGTRDVFVFDTRGSANPATLSAIGTNYVTRKYTGADSDQTGRSNHYALARFNPVMNNISDGQGDMFDSGNFVSVVAVDNSTNFSITDGNYGTTADNGTYGYFLSGTGTWPQTTAVKISSGNAQITTRGNTGSDGRGIVQNYDGTYTCTNGRTGSYWANINYGAGDPTIGDLWFTIQLPAWGTANITKTADTRKTSDNPDNYNHSITVSGSNFLFVKMLISKTAGQLIQTADVQTFLQSYVQAADLGATFATTSLTSFYNWHMTNASAIYATMPSAYNYVYDGSAASARFFENYTYSVLLDGAQSFITSSFTGSDVALDNVMLNEEGVLLPWNDGTTYKARIFKSTGIIDITLAGSATGYNSNYTMIPLNGYFMHYIYNSSTGRYDWYIVRGSNNVLIGMGSSSSNSFVTSGSRAIFNSGINIFSYFLNGSLTILSESGFVQKQTNYDDGNNILLFYRNDFLANNVSFLTTSAFSRQSIDKNPASVALRVVSESSALFAHNSPFSLRIVYPDAKYSYNETDASISYNGSSLKTEQSYTVRVSSSATGRTGWITFSRDTVSFNKDMATQAYGVAEGVQTNYVFA